MTTTAMLIWIAVTTIYGYIMYKRGYIHGAREIVDMQVEAGIVTDKMKMYQRLAKHFGKDEGA